MPWPGPLTGPRTGGWPRTPPRAEIDGAVEAALGLPPLGDLRELLAPEPIVCLGAG
jgi:hypothetical protein